MPKKKPIFSGKGVIRLSQQPQTIIHEHRNIENPPDLKVEISRGMKGGYSWSISYSGKIDDKEVILRVIEETDKDLRGKYPVEPAKEDKKEK